MRRSKKQLQIFSLSFLDVICCGLGAVLIVLLLYSVKLREREKKASELEKQNATLIAANRNHYKILSAVSNKLLAAKAKISDLEKNNVPRSEYAKLKKELSDLKKNSISISKAKKLQQQLKIAQETKTILGVSISKKKLVFLIDASGSMKNEKDDARLSDAKGAFKSMIASLDPSYSIDMAWFTSDSNGSLVVKPIWNRLTPVNSYKKRAAMNFVTGVEPLGGTPTMGAFKYVFKNYPDAEAIVLLSDGAPTDFATQNSYNWGKSASGIKQLNRKNIPIYCIGVGKEMANSYSEARRFLEQVAKESGGDCVTF